MTKIIPLKGLRPKTEVAAEVASLPYDVLTAEEARKYKDYPYSFLHVTRSEIDLPPKTDPHSPEVYEMAKENLNRFIKQGILFQDKEPSYYIYRLIMNGRSQTGLVCGSLIDDYNNGIIKKHELTRPDKVLDRINHIKATRAQTGVVFLAYNDVPSLNELIETWKTEHKPDYDFTTEDGIQHTIWAIHDYGKINTVSDTFENEVPCTYIADGHHRAASAAKVAEEMTKQGLRMTGDESFNYFLTCIFPASELNILPYNRLVKDLNGMAPQEFLEKLKTDFRVEALGGEKPFVPQEKHVFSMYLDGVWYSLHPKESLIHDEDPIDGLDVSILQKNILGKYLGISDPRVDKRIEFAGGIRGLKYLAENVNAGKNAVAFALYPVNIHDIFKVADNNKVMPPKSTWFEPKTRDGLVVYQI